MFTIPPENPPLIMIGPGTGVCPFIGFLEERQKQATEGKSAQLSEATLYFGCRSRDSDFIFKEVLESAESTKLVNLNTAFSRPSDGSAGVYVQALLTQHRAILEPLIAANSGSNPGALIMICGNTKMGQEVQTVLKEWVGLERFRELEKQGRIVKELWMS